MTEGQVIKFMCVVLLCPGVGIETVALDATCLAIYYIYLHVYIYPYIFIFIPHSLFFCLLFIYF